MAVSVIGIDYRSAPLAMREQIAMNGDQVRQLLRVITAERLFREIMVLSTCNRTEIYFADAHPPGQPLPHLLGHIAQIKGVAPPEDLSGFYGHEGAAAVRHLFRVASSLESQVVGEHEILGQVKEAYRLACEVGTARFLFHKLLHRAFRAGKRAMTETGLGRGTASVSQAAVDLAHSIFSNLADKTVLLVGAGQTAELAAQALIREGVTHLIIANRTALRAEQLSESFHAWRESNRLADRHEAQPGGFTCPALAKMLADCSLQAVAEPPLEIRVIGLAEIPQVLAGVDLVISSTGAPEPVLTRVALEPALRQSRRSLLLIDIAVPRDIEPQVSNLPNVFLYNIDDLESLIAKNLELRRREIPQAEAIIEDEVVQFTAWLSTLKVVPTIKLLQARIARLQEEHLERYCRKVSAQDRAQFEEFARTLCNRMLHDPITFLRQAGQEDEESSSLANIDLIWQIFKLDAVEEER